MSSFLLTCLLLLLFCANAALHWSHSLPANICYPNITSFLLTTCPSLIPFPAKKGFICRILSQKAEYEHFSANYMPFTDRIPCQKAFVTPCEFFSANCMPLLAEFSIEKALLPHMISVFTNYMPFLASFFIKKALLSHMSSFLLNKCPSLVQVSVRKPLSHEC